MMDRIQRAFLLQSALLLLGFFFCSVSCNILWEQVEPKTIYNEAESRTSEATSTVQKDITTPLTTVPTIKFPPTTTAPVLNPNSIPEEPQTWNPFETPTTSSSPPLTSGASWCVATQNAARTALQIALDYACGRGGADCSAIQPGGGCFFPNTLHDHASYAFNRYYQKNPIPNSCNFGGTAVLTSTDPSSRMCQYPSTSTSSSVLDTTNQNVSTVFGVGPPGPSSSAIALFNRVSYLLRSMSFIVLLLRYLT